jgi:hypothetical protein
MPTQKLSPEIINAAIDGFEAQKEQIEEKIVQLRAMRDGTPGDGAGGAQPAVRKRRKLSAAARARIAEAQRKRWAESRKETGNPSEVPPTQAKAKRRLSAAGRRAIIAATKKRWAAVREAAAKTKPAAAGRRSGAKKMVRKRVGTKTQATKPAGTAEAASS